MRTYLRIIALLASCLFAIPAQADLLDQMLSNQAATTTIGKMADSTSITATPGQGHWSRRTFGAQLSQRCLSGSPSSVGIASAGTGITNVEMRNAQGEVSITWNFARGIPLSSFPYAGFEVDLVNTSKASEVAIRTVAILSTNARDLTITYQGVRVGQKLSPQGKAVAFDFQKISPLLFKDAATVVRSLTLKLSSPTSCDSSFAVQLARWLPRGSSTTTANPKRRTQDGNSPSPHATVRPTPSPGTNPCEEDPTVPDKIKECEDEHNRTASGCSLWKCACSPSSDGKTFTITGVSQVSGSDSKDMTGGTCSNQLCGGAPGRCSDFGDCIPSQFYGYNNPSISVSADGVSFRLGSPANEMDLNCMSTKQLPRTPQLCDMTIAQVEESVLNAIKVGAPCPLPVGKNGVCSNTGQCVPDTSSDAYCSDHVDCTPCGAPGSICRDGKCITIQEATRKLCESVGVQGGYGRGTCSTCFAMFKLNPDGSCGTGLLAPDRRGVDMSGAPCSRKDMPRGICSAGQCIPSPRPSPVGTATKAPRS